MTVEEINNDLLRIYEEWLHCCAERLNNQKPVSKKHKEYANAYGYSAPFITGLPSHFENYDKKRILIYGQEAHNWLKFESYTSLKELQEEAIEYYNENMNDRIKNSSPFWHMMRGLNKAFVPCWANLDKLHRVYQANDAFSQQLEFFEEEEKILLSPLSNNKNIIQNEIEIVNPEAIVFITGPDYHKATKYALGMPNYNTKKLVPNINGEVILELTPYTCTRNKIPVFWTYHPNFMNYHNLDEHIKNLIEKITNATN